MGKRKGTRYDLEFQKNAVELWLKSGKSAAQVASELGISEQSLHRWKERQLGGRGDPGGGALAEIERLRKENRVLREERDILKKFVAVFWKPPK